MKGHRYNFRSCKRRTIIDAEYGPLLHESVMYQILLRLPASVLYNVMRYICKCWFNIISNPNFKQEHLFHSSNSTQGGLLVDYKLSVHGCFFLSHADMKPNIVNKTRRLDKFFPRGVMDTCDGLLLIHLHNGSDPLFFEIINPVTKQCHRYFIPNEAYVVLDFKILRSRITSSRHYNIVCAYTPKVGSSEERLPVPPFCCGISVLSFDGRKNIYGGKVRNHWHKLSLDEKYRQGYLLGHCCLSTTQGYMYVKVSDVQRSSPWLLSVDVDRKVVREIPAPPCFVSYDSANCPLSQGRYLTAIDICTTDTNLKLNGWIWNGAQSKWTVLFSLRPSIPSAEFSSCPLFRVWIKDEQVLVFGTRFIASYYLCNVKTGQVSSILRFRKHNVNPRGASRVYNHTESLVFLP